jgi:hypothetical protein
MPNASFSAVLNLTSPNTAFTTETIFSNLSVKLKRIFQIVYALSLISETEIRNSNELFADNYLNIPEKKEETLET